jgi:acyl transferase domain-containing protein
MELEMNDVLNSLTASMERLSAAASALEMTAVRLEQREATMSGDVQKITAAVEGNGEGVHRELELERKLAVAEQEIAELMAAGRGSFERPTALRKTLPAATVQLLAKQGIDSLDIMDTPTLDAALTGLSIEQRLAVKSQLLRSGAVIS